jgi:DNA polymerase I-like protein with 3'-5' exonuclease and polymerase domains
LKTFHRKSPKIQAVFHAEIIEALRRDNGTLTASFPYGLDLDTGGKRIFYERWGDELFREAFSYIPQRSITDNTKAAGIRLKRVIPDLRIIMEAHDSLLFEIREDEVKDIIPIIREEMERPIDFSKCSLPRHNLIIPCDIEVGYDYRNLKKFKNMELQVV